MLIIIEYFLVDESSEASDLESTIIAKLGDKWQEIKKSMDFYSRQFILFVVPKRQTWRYKALEL